MAVRPHALISQSKCPIQFAAAYESEHLINLV
jgi:hypothetical protein